MKILLLEDDTQKKDAVIAEIAKVDGSIEVTAVGNFKDYLIAITKCTYDLIVVDLVVLMFPDDSDPIDMTGRIIEVTRDHTCHNFRTPVVALTRFEVKAQENFKDLNAKDITVITFDDGNEKWTKCIREKVSSCIPPIHFEFVIICALKKEADAFTEAGYKVEERMIFGNLSCQKMQIGDRSGVIVTAPRAGLVSAAIITTQAIELFKPRLVCMSGICAGVPGVTKIYDVILPDVCHQNDAGKWIQNDFQSEVYAIQLDHGMRTNIDSVISGTGFLDRIGKGIVTGENELPSTERSLTFKVFLAPASSGSAVIATETAVNSIKGQQRKLAAFEMESFAVYESARLSVTKPQYFSAKAVVDDGTSSKGDAFHRVASILAARVVYECIKAGVCDSESGS